MRVLKNRRLLEEANKNKETGDKIALEKYGQPLAKLRKKERAKIVSDYLEGKIVPYGWLRPKKFNIRNISENVIWQYHIFNNRYGDYFIDNNFMIKNRKVAQSFRDKYWEREKKSMLKYTNDVEYINEVIESSRKKEDEFIVEGDKWVEWASGLKDKKLYFLKVMAYVNVRYDKPSLDYPVYLFMTKKKDIIGLNEMYVLLLLDTFGKDIEFYTTTKSFVLAYLNNEVVGAITTFTLDLNFIEYIEKIIKGG